MTTQTKRLWIVVAIMAVLTPFTLSLVFQDRAILEDMKAEQVKYLSKYDAAEGSERALLQELTQCFDNKYKQVVLNDHYRFVQAQYLVYGKINTVKLNSAMTQIQAHCFAEMRDRADLSERIHNLSGVVVDLYANKLGGMNQ